MNVLRTIKLRLNIQKEDCQKILDTMKAYSTAFNISAKWGFENRTYSKIKNNAATYRTVRSVVPELQSSLVQGARDVACEALKQTKFKVLPIRKEYSAIRYNQRVCTLRLESKYATLATVKGRVKTTFFLPKYYEKYAGWQVKSSNLCYDRRARKFYLMVSLEAANPKAVEEVKVLGIDRGIKNIAVTSDNQFFDSKAINKVRAKYNHLRVELQALGTRSAKRKLKRLSGRERRFVADVNHCITKEIVNSNSTIFALEDLSKIRVQRRHGKKTNLLLNSWAFYQFELFLRYKAENIGKQVMFVDARYTSQKCSKCGHTYKGNRDGNVFKCRRCGYETHADRNASLNIAQDGISVLGRLNVNQPIVAS